MSALSKREDPADVMAGFGPSFLRVQLGSIAPDKLGLNEISEREASCGFRRVLGKINVHRNEGASVASP